MKIAVTGISGYLGQLLLRQLDAEPAAEAILGLDVTPPRQVSPKLTFRHADVRTAPFDELLRGYDVLYHLAFIVEPRRELSAADVDAINIGGSERVLRGAIAAGVPKLIVASSVAAYGAHADNPVPLTEDSPLRPNANWYYSRTKGEVERLLDELQREYPHETIIRFRPSVFLGPTVNNSMGKLFDGRFVVCVNRTLKTDLCWDEDVADAFRRALFYDRSDAFNLTGGNPLTAEEAARILGKRVVHLNRRWAVRLFRLACALGLRPRAAVEWVETAASASVLVSAERARQRLGWQPRFDSAATLRKYVDSIR
jgi:UDP-glucose 4-epimerase